MMSDPERYLTMMKPNTNTNLFLYQFLGPIYEIVVPYLDSYGLVILDVVVNVIHGLAMTFFLVFISHGLIQFPGHTDGSFLPIFIPEHYGKRNSQHPFDPYR